MNTEEHKNVLQNSGRAPRGWLATLSFGCTLVIWVAAYVLSMPGIAASAWILLAVAGVVLFAGGIVAGRSATQSVGHGVLLGVTITAINLLILGSLGSGGDAGDVMRTALPWIGGFFACAVVLCTAGLLVGRASARSGPGTTSWIGRFAAVVAITTLVLITAGGVVTGLEAGMAVPDWLTTFSYPMMLYPLELMKEDPGRYFEHFHRLWGLLVGLSTIVLVIHLFLFDRRSWVKWTGMVILLLVIIQGIFGGTRITENNLTLAIVHGVFGQIVFALLVCMAAFTSPHWVGTAPRTRIDKAKSDYALASALLVVVVLQIALGAVYRHLSSDREVSEKLTFALVNAHMGLGVLLALKLEFVGMRAWARRKDYQPLSRIGLVLVILTPLQILLGIVAYVMVEMAKREPDDPIAPIEVLLTGMHQVTGALILAASALLLVWTHRLLDKTHG